MADGPGIEAALTRFESALDLLEAALAEVQPVEQRPEVPEGEIVALREDRARMAEELDQVRNNASKLLEANTQAEARINSAMERIKTVLGE